MSAQSVPILAVGGVVLADGPTVLLVQRGHAPMSGRWSLPGGHLELGESLRDAVRREIFEEARVQVEVGDLLEVVEILTEGFHYVVLDYLCWPIDEAAEPVAGDDAVAARYASASDLESLGVSEGVIHVVQKALQLRSRREQAAHHD